MPVPPLRPYQEEAVEGLRDGLRRGIKRQILCAPTGSGKTVCAAHMIEASQKVGGGQTLFLVDRVALVRQTSHEFRKFGIDHGVVQGDYTHGRHHDVQVCSMQSLEKRGFLSPFGKKPKVIFNDECHIMRKAIVKHLIETEVPTIGLTATPLTVGLGAVYSEVVDLITTNQLVAQGWLAKLKVCAASQPDMTGAATSGGEWTGRAVEERGKVIIGDIVSTWLERTQQFFSHPVKTICFSATVAHGAEICEAFQEAGYDFRQVSYLDRDDEDRQRKIELFRAGKIMGLVSVDALQRGFDVPDTMCLIAARPYKKSLAAHIQQIGRVMRMSPGKEFGLILDHCGNWLGFLDQTMDFFRNGPGELDDGSGKKEPAKRVKKPPVELVCVCGMVMPVGATMCPVCGKVRKRRNDVTVKEGRLRQVQGVQGAVGWARPEVGDYVWEQCCRLAVEKRSDPDLAIKAARGYFMNLTGAWPNWNRTLKPSFTVDSKLERDLKSGLRRYWTMRKYRRGGGTA